MVINIASDEVALSNDAMLVKKAINDMVAFAKNLVVNTEESYRSITALYKKAREWKKSLEAKRKELVDPFRSQIADINDKAKVLSDPLDAVIELANAKVNGYQKLLEEKKQKEEAELREVAALFDAGEDIYVPPVEKIIRGDGAIAVTKIEKKFRVVDITKVPAKYLAIDEKAVTLDLKLGLDAISGLEIYEETTTQLRTR